MSEKTGLAKIGSLSTLAGQVIDRIFQLDRLDALARQSMFVRVAYAEAICLINYVILAQSTIHLEQLEFLGITIASKEFKPTLQGKLDALSICFSHVAGKLDTTMNTMNASTVLNSLDFIGDIAAAVAQVVAKGVPSTVLHGKV